jgi:hypothetical protein
MLHRHVCSCGDWRLCTERDCLPGEHEQCLMCADQQQRELDRERAYRLTISQRTPKESHADLCQR